MIKRLLKIPVYLFNKAFSIFSPVLYAKFIGVNIKGKVYIYGPSTTMFSAEPYLITLGDNVHITLDVKFIPHDGGTLILRHLDKKLEKAGRIVVGDNVFIGVNTIILPSVVIGSNCIIAAGSIVTKDLPSNGVYGGNPCRFISTIDDYYEKTKSNSLNIGHLSGKDKVNEYKKHFNL